MFKDGDYEVCYAGTSLAHTFGNVASIISEYIKSRFPKNYFRSELISTSIAYRQVDVLRKKGKEFFKRDKPILIIRPRIDLTDTDLFMQGSLLTDRIYDSPDTTTWGMLQEFFEDRENDIIMKYLLARLKMTFDVTIIHETMVEQVNTAYYFQNTVSQNHPFFLDVYLEGFIPKEILEVISDKVEIPLKDENGKAKPFLDYLNGHSHYPITYKVQNSTALDEYFRFYPARIDTMFTGLSIDDGSKRGFTFDTFTTNFSVTTEFWGTALYYLFRKNKDNTQIKEVNRLSSLETPSAIIPIFSMPIRKIRAPENWNEYSSLIFKIDPETVKKTKEDVLDFGSIIAGNIEACIRYHKENGIPLETLITERVLVNANFLSKEDGDYTVDYDDFKLTLKNHLSPIATYTLVIFVNTLYMNELKKKIFDLKTE